ncbi:HalOD1 output domain-containing protein [Halobaculum limi]|uniref:HalOD1 output domain-containing protein n=1 Tax=Halobaculum limi TaxID=3031916 RepID=UPI0024063316|nr:HalOD1 output domain-containing protein [Halobaculum sp. YSMS11]
MRPGDTTTGAISRESTAVADHSKTHYTTFEPTSPDICVDIAREVALSVGEDPTEIEPLATAVDPDSVNALVGGNRSPGAGWTELSFEYIGYIVTVCSDGVLTIDAADD